MQPNFHQPSEAFHRIQAQLRQAAQEMGAEYATRGPKIRKAGRAGYVYYVDGPWLLVSGETRTPATSAQARRLNRIERGEG